MVARKVFSVALAVLWSAVVVSCSYGPYPSPCTEPAVRKEWRAFSAEEKVEWIRAVNVRIDIPPILSSCSQNIRNPVLVKTAS
jgi:hypothetical protein